MLLASAPVQTVPLLRDSQSQILSRAHQGHPDHYRLSLNPGWHPLIENTGEKGKASHLCCGVIIGELSPQGQRGAEEPGLPAPTAELLHTQPKPKEVGRNGLRQLKGGFTPPHLSI